MDLYRRLPFMHPVNKISKNTLYKISTNCFRTFAFYQVQLKIGCLNMILDLLHAGEKVIFFSSQSQYLLRCSASYRCNSVLVAFFILFYFTRTAHAIARTVITLTTEWRWIGISKEDTKQSLELNEKEIKFKLLSCCLNN